MSQEWRANKMKQIIQNEHYGEIVYDENFWTGKKSLSINGEQLQKVSKKEFKMSNGDLVSLTGSFFQGAVISINGETIRVVPTIKWYEIVLCIIPLILNVVWGNSVALCKIIPVVGGAIGGAINGAFAVLILAVLKSVKPIWLKILIAIAMTILSFAICYGIAMIILAVA